MEAGLILLGLWVVHPVQGSRKVVEGFGLIWISLERHFPVGNGFGRFSRAFEVPAKQVLRVGIVRLQRDNLLKELYCALHVIDLSFGKGEEIERPREVGQQARSRFEFSAGLIVFGGFEKEAAQVVVNSRRVGLQARGFEKLLESGCAIVSVHESNTKIQVRVR